MMKELVSCMIELFSESSWDNYIQTNIRKVLFLTSGGQLIVFPTGYSSGMATHENWNAEEHYLSENPYEFIRDYVDETVWKFFYEAINKPTMSQLGWHICIVVWSLGLYLDRYHKKEILESNGKTPVETIKEIVWDYFNDGDDFFQAIVIKTLDEARMCRLEGINLNTVEISPTPNVTGIRRYSESGYTGRGELNIETYHSLTDSQRRVMLDIIEVSGVGLDKIFLDDHSKEQSIKRQLGLHSIVAQFHR